MFLLKALNLQQKLSNIRKLHVTYFEVPERYRSCLHLANASFFNCVNWYLNRAYEISFSTLVKNLQDNDNLTAKDAVNSLKKTISCLEQCNSIIDVRFPVELENGSYEIIRGYRANHGLYSGCKTCLGGLRISDTIIRDQVKALAVLATYKAAFMEVKMSGAAGGIRINPSHYKENDLKRIIQCYCEELLKKGYCNGISDVIEPDLNTCSEEMRWLASILDKSATNFAVVGKPYEMNGLSNHDSTTSKGIYFALDYLLNNEKILKRTLLKKGIKDKTFIIQNLEKLGLSLVRYLIKSGAVCVGVKDPDAYFYDKNGINIEELILHKQAHGTIKNFKKTIPKNEDIIFFKPCDILILAGHINSLVYHMAPKVKAKVIIEASSGAITPNSYMNLIGNSKLVLPDIYVNSGSLIASYIEYLMNLSQTNYNIGPIEGIFKNIIETFDDSKQVKGIVLSATTQKIIGCNMDNDVLAYTIEHVMAEKTQEILDVALSFELDLDLKTAAYIIAIQNTLHNIAIKNK